MNIKTITCHDVYNFGASLQAYALQTFLEENGHDVQIIDYLPKYKHFYEFFKASEIGFIGRFQRALPLLEPLWAVLQHRKWFYDLRKIQRFKYFKKQVLHCTKETYRDIAELKANKPQADLYIAGSDQIWNTAFQNGLDPVYYCIFESDRNKCITYAASFGISEIPLENQEFVKKGLSNFRAISIRENSGVALAKSLGFDSVNVLDPVFLLTKEQWQTLCKREHKEKYLLVYDFANKDERVKNLSVLIAKERHLKIYSFNGKPDYADRHLNTCGPVEFIEWIAGADMVISNSFHATAFSVIFQRDFYTIPLKGYENSSRMRDFLTLIGLSERYVSNVASIDTKKRIDYTKASIKLKEAIEYSQKWLLNNLKK